MSKYGKDIAKRKCQEWGGTLPYFVSKKHFKDVTNELKSKLSMLVEGQNIFKMKLLSM